MKDPPVNFYVESDYFPYSEKCCVLYVSLLLIF